LNLDEAGRLLALNSQRHLRPAREMAALFRDIPGAIETTVDLSARLQFELSDLGYEFPHYSVPDGETMDSFLHKRVAEGVHCRYGPKNDRDLMERAKRQVKNELTLIAKLGFAGYFLIVWDIVQYCKSTGILIQGAAALPILPFAMRLKSQPSTRSAWSFSSSVF
jgi:error-prone DNA polymerase